MSYGEKVLSRLLTPGFAVIAVGALLVFLAGFLVRGVDRAKREQARLMLKGIGCLVTVAGMIIFFTA